MAPTTLGDILLGLTGNAYSSSDPTTLWPFQVLPGGYKWAESYRTRPNPATQPRSLSSFEHQDNWMYFGQDDWQGTGFPRYGVTTFKDGYGILLDAEGQIEIARKLSKVSDITLTDSEGYIVFTVDFGPEWGPTVNTRVVVIGKTGGDCWSIPVLVDGSIGASQHYGNIFGSAKGCTGAIFFNNAWFIGDANGHVWQMNFTAGTGAVAAPTDAGSFSSFTGGGNTETDDHDVQFLGVLGRRLYVGMNHVNGLGTALNPTIYTMDDTYVWENPFVDVTDQAVVTGASGGGGLYVVTRGSHCRVGYITDDGTTRIYRQIGTIGTSFVPKAAVYLDRLILFGVEYEDTRDGATPAGVAWEMTAGGFAEIFKFQSVDTNGNIFNQGFQCAVQEGERVLWGASRGGFDGGVVGFGIFDPTLEDQETSGLGWFVSGTAPAATGSIVVGVTSAHARVFVGIVGDGVYYQTTPGPFMVEGGVYGADQRNIDKLWGEGEVRHSAFLNAGQYVNLKTRKDPDDSQETWSATSGTGVGAKLTFYESPGEYRTPYLTYVIKGDAFGYRLLIYDIALAYIRMADPTRVKREWTLVLDVSGMLDPKTGISTRKYRDATDDPRIWSDLYAALNSMWNKEVVFQDADGTMYDGTTKKKVLFKSPSGSAETQRSRFPELDRKVSGGAVVNLSEGYTVHLVEQ